MHTWVSTSDPGIVPRRVEELDAPTFASVTLHAVNSSSGISDVVSGADKAGGKGELALRLRYCTTCELYRGPRTHHCAFCNSCVDQMDHHCQWTGTCIGARNYHKFLYFLHALHVFAFLSVVSATASVTQLSARRDISVLSAIVQLGVIPLIIFALVLTIGWSITGLLILHWWLLVRNRSTLELIKVLMRDRNPFDLGVWRNVWTKFSGTVSPWVWTEMYRGVVVREIIRQKRQRLMEAWREILQVRRLRETPPKDSRINGRKSSLSGDAPDDEVLSGNEARAATAFLEIMPIDEGGLEGHEDAVELE
jgi:hypothetical protein